MSTETCHLTTADVDEILEKDISFAGACGCAIQEYSCRQNARM